MKHAELFAGYGGLSLAVEQAFHAELAWYSEWDDAPARIMSRHWPGVPNYGDVTAIDWNAVEPVDIISGGFPCQDVSAAGRRAGMAEGTRTNLWGAMRSAIETIAPTYVVAENVRGLLSAKASSESDLEPGHGPLGEAPGDNLRALGRVLGDLADLGYDAEWRTVRASDVGAPHRRERVFILAWRRDAAATDGERSRDGGRHGSPGASQRARQAGAAGGPDGPYGGARPAQAVKRLPTPQAHLGSNGGSQHPDKRRAGGHTATLADVVEHLLPTPAVADVQGGRKTRSGARSDELLLNGIAAYGKFGEYAPAMARWEQATGRPAPDPTEISARGGHRLSARFAEWMMGVPDGWICDTEGVTRRDAIKAAGNGVVPQQAVRALSDMVREAPL